MNSDFEQRLDEAFGVKELKRAKTKLKRTKVGPPDQEDKNANTPPIPQVSHFLDKGEQSGFSHRE